MYNISKGALNYLREQFPVGARVELTKMNDPYSTKPTEGDRGTVRAVDDCGTIHVAWDCGSSLGVVYGEDACRRLYPVTVTCYGTTEVWEDRMEALKFYKQGATECEGAERDRYTRIVFQLLDGKSVCTDEEDDE